MEIESNKLAGGAEENRRGICGENQRDNCCQVRIHVSCHVTCPLLKTHSCFRIYETRPRARGHPESGFWIMWTSVWELCLCFTHSVKSQNASLVVTVVTPI